MATGETSLGNNEQQPASVGLDQAVTNTTGDVYAFTGALDPMMVAAAMARLSRSPADMRDIIENEFLGREGRAEGLLDRVITLYGDDSVQQLVGTHMVVEGASNLLTKELEWGRLASYLEQSTRYIFFDETDEHGKFKYYRPENLDSTTYEQYVSSMDKIFVLYSDIVHQMIDYYASISTVPETERDAQWRIALKGQACDAARKLLPVATKSTVGIFASGQALEMAIMRLAASESDEARTVGAQMLQEARKVIPNFLKRADLPERGAAYSAYIEETRSNIDSVAELLPITPAEGEPPIAVSLDHYWPEDEEDLLPFLVFDRVQGSMRDIREAIETLTQDERDALFDAYIGDRLNRRQKPGRALEQPRYTWELVCDYGIFRDLQRHRMVDDLRWQKLTPYLGYEVPEDIINAGLEDQYRECFAISSNLYETLTTAGNEHEAQFATLLGHNMRWTITYNAREAFHLHELRTSPQGHPGYRKLVKEMHEKLCEVHPKLGKAMRFVNMDEDPELTRLAAERATAFKLRQLDKNKEV